MAPILAPVPRVRARRRARPAGGMARLVAVLMALVAVLALGAVLLVLEAEPAVAADLAVDVQDVERALALLRANDPRQAPTGEARVMTVTQRDADLLVAHAAQRLPGVRGGVTLHAGEAELTASVARQVGPWRRWINVRVWLREGTPRPEVTRVRVGAMPVPRALVARLVPVVLARLPLAPTLATSLPTLLGALDGVRIAPGALEVRYRWTAGMASGVMDNVVTPAERGRLRVYHDRLLADLTAGATAGGATAPARPMVTLLPPLMALAARRGEASGDAAPEVRAALLTLALYAVDRPLGRLLPSAASWPLLPQQPVVLGGRQDLAKHFLVSAVLVVEGSSPLAQAVGVYKEVSDSRAGGSGFSFADLAADLAGTRLGELARRDPARLAAQLAAGMTEAACFPSVAGLPEGVDSATFAQAYGGMAGAETARWRAEVNRRVEALALYR
ncbi:MAG: hypothetical protein KJT01_02685 [Gemmatimonadetes bacterium]|nr:hypothetical protein [Gemmatimonadota bacterium]